MDGFSDSDDELSGSYRCSDPDHCDRGVDCDGDHTYSEEYLRSRISEGSEERMVDGIPGSDSHAVQVDCDGDEDSGEAPQPICGQNPVMMILTTMNLTLTIPMMHVRVRFNIDGLVQY